MMDHSKRKLALTAILGFTTFGGALAQTYLPLDIDVPSAQLRVGQKVQIGNLTIEITGELPNQQTKLENHLFKYTHANQDVSAKIGIPSIGLEASNTYDNVFVDNWRYHVVQAKVQVGSGPQRAAYALMGHGVRLSFKSNDLKLGANGGLGSVDLKVSFKKSTDNFAIESHGFTTFHPVLLETDEAGNVSSVQLSKAISDAFNLYAGDGNSALGTPHFFGLSVSEETVKELVKK